MNPILQEILAVYHYLRDEQRVWVRFTILTLAFLLFCLIVTASR